MALASRVKFLLEAGNPFAEFSRLATQQKAVNLGQGFPSFPPPAFLTKSLEKAISREVVNMHQYTFPSGHPVLCEEIINVYSPLFGRRITTPEIGVFCGAQEAIHSILTAVCDAGDEILIIEPSFDCYAKSARLLDISVRTVPLLEQSSGGSRNANDWQLDLDLLERSITPKTKLLIINTPSSPIGKTYTRYELEQIASIVQKHKQLFVLSDEVYEFICFGPKHERFATLDGMRDRTISVFSAGKTFCCTGWRIGFTIAPPAISASLSAVMSAMSFCAPTPLQIATGYAFNELAHSDYRTELSQSMAGKANRLWDALDAAGMRPVRPNGGFFIWASAPSLPQLKSLSDTDTCRWLGTHGKVVGIPGSVFYEDQRQTGSIRFAFCKNDDEITAGCNRILEFGSLRS